MCVFKISDVQKLFLFIYIDSWIDRYILESQIDIYQIARYKIIPRNIEIGRPAFGFYRK